MEWDMVIGSVFALVVFFGVVDTICVLWSKNERFNIRDKKEDK